MQRNMYECIRSIFHLFGPKKLKSDEEEVPNKLINRLVGYFAPNNTFISKGANIPNNSASMVISEKSYSNKLLHLILRIKEFEARIRSRFIYGLSCLLTYSEQPAENIDLLIK